MMYKYLPSLTILFTIILFVIPGPLNADISLEERLFTEGRIECSSPELDMREITGRRTIENNTWHIITLKEQPSLDVKLVILDIVSETGGLDGKYFIVRSGIQKEIAYLEFAKEYNRYFPPEVRNEFQTLWDSCVASLQKLQQIL